MNLEPEIVYCDYIQLSSAQSWSESQQKVTLMLSSEKQGVGQSLLSMQTPLTHSVFPPQQKKIPVEGSTHLWRSVMYWFWFHVIINFFRSMLYSYLWTLSWHLGTQFPIFSPQFKFSKESPEQHSSVSFLQQTYWPCV